MTTDDFYVRLNSILDKATESLTKISEEREKQNTHFSNLIEDLEAKNNSLTENFTKFKNTSRRAEMTVIEDLTNFRKEVKDNYSTLDTKITELGSQIKDIQKCMEELKKKQSETELTIGTLESKVKKRKWWKLF
jgi:chromosome segregation ATPase